MSNTITGFNQAVMTNTGLRLTEALTLGHLLDNANSDNRKDKDNTIYTHAVYTVAKDDSDILGLSDSDLKAVLKKFIKLKFKIFNARKIAKENAKCYFAIKIFFKNFPKWG